VTLTGRSSGKPSERAAASCASRLEGWRASAFKRGVEKFFGDCCLSNDSWMTLKS